LLFVFGFKAKKLRQAKLSDLIHSSSDAQPDSASVELFFQEIMDDNDEYQVVPNSQFTVKRTVSKSDASSYYINDKKATYATVQALLKGYGIDLDHKRFLILQGEVESIALMKPKGVGDEDGLLEYLEDIIGTSSMKEPIEEALKQYTRLNEEYEHELVQFKHIQKETNSLRGKSEEALKYIEWENRIIVLQSQFFQLQKFQAKHAIEKQREEMLQVQNQLDEMSQGQEEEDHYLKELQGQLQALQHEYKQLKHLASSTNETMVQIEKEQVELKETEKYLTQKKKKLQKQAQQDKHQQSEDQVWISNFESDVGKARKSLEELKQRLVKEQQALEDIQMSLQGKTRVFQEQIEAKQTELAPWLEKRNEKEAALGLLKSEQELVRSKVEGGKESLARAQKTLQEALHSLNGSKSKIQGVSEQLTSLNEQKGEKLESLESLRRNTAQSKEAYDTAVSKLRDAQVMDKQQKDGGQVVSSLMQLKKKKKIPGICGRLGDLGTIDVRYDVAVTTACSALDSIVVETVEDAQQCIEFLKREKIGRANFLCLDKLKQQNMDKISTPENVPRLFDLIKPSEDRFRVAFYHGLTDTLVAKDLDQANRVAYGKQRFRVVTLDGQLIDKSGTMSGGGTVVKRGGMSSKSKVSAHDLERMEAEVNDLEAQYDSFQSQFESMEAQLEELQDSITALNMEYSRLELEISSHQSQIKDFEQAVVVAKENAEPDPADVKRLKELNKKISLSQSELDSLVSSCQPLEDDIRQLQDKIMEVGGVRMRTQKAKVDSLLEQIDQNQHKISNLQAEKSSREKNLKKSGNVIDKREREMEQIEQELAKTLEAYNDTCQRIASAKEESREASNELETKEEEVARLKELLQERSAALNKAKLAEVKLKAQLTSLKQLIHANEVKIEKADNEMKGLQLQTTGLEDEEIAPELALFSEEELAAMNLKHLSNELERTKQYFAGTQPNLGVLREYKSKMQVYRERSDSVEMASKRRDEKKQEYDDLRKQRLDTFMDGFGKISLKLKEMYQVRMAYLDDYHGRKCRIGAC
jgi:structural maintenance of chromosome 4